MRILFLDDMKTRRDAFKQNAIGFTVDFAKNAQEAITFLNKNEYDVIYLDHDLEEEHYKSNEDHHEDGRFVARKMREMPQHHGKVVIIHSLNEDGRKNIESILKDLYTVYKGPETFKVDCIWQFNVKIVLQAIGLIPIEE